jgi:pullulanase
MIMINAVVVDFNRIKLIYNEPFNFDIRGFNIKNGYRNIEIKAAYPLNGFMILQLKEELDLKYECFIEYSNTIIKAVYREIFTTEEFNRRYFTNVEFGYIYCANNILFRVWSPAAYSINVLLYKNGDPELREDPRRIPMTEEKGLWSLIMNENLKEMFYTYEVKVYGETNEAVDPYAKAVGINGLRGAIVDLKETNPVGFEGDTSPNLDSFTDAIIYEASVRDISMHPDSGIKNKGKFLGLTEENTKSSKGLSTGLNHILELGITHVQLMPIYDFSFASTDEKDSFKYNWGYDPQNYNTPEGSYCTNPYNPMTRISELKTLVKTLHEKGLAVNMDVVYNHVFNLETENLERIFPGYYFRFLEDGKASNGSGCSNDTASERLMVRKFIVDSVYYWAKEYHLDGFRFDLMGLHDVTTMNAVREKLNTLERPIMLYGEGWVLSTMLAENLKANQLNFKKMPHIGHFNDTLRNAVRGSIFISQEKGFSSGKENIEEIIKTCVSGSIFQTPDQSINYVSAHDNNTLWDKLKLSNSEDQVETLKSIQKLSNAIVITCQGIPFIHSGAEFCRTKYGIENSVFSEDKINWMDWDRKAEFIDVFQYYKGLIRLRREHSAFRMNNALQIKKHLEFLAGAPKNTVAFILKNYANNDNWKDIVVIYNANRENISISIPEGNWNVVADKYSADTNVLRTFTGNSVEVSGISMSVLYR